MDKITFNNNKVGVCAIQQLLKKEFYLIIFLLIDCTILVEKRILSNNIHFDRLYNSLMDQVYLVHVPSTGS